MATLAQVIASKLPKPSAPTLSTAAQVPNIPYSANPYYSDPAFSARMQAVGSTTQKFGGPFAATRNSIAQRLQGNRSVGLQNMLANQRAASGYQQAGFKNSMDWAQWNNQLAMAQNDLVARQQINQQRQAEYNQRMAAYKAKKGNKILGTMKGAMQGGMAGGQVGGPWGAVAGGIIGGASGYAAS